MKVHVLAGDAVIPGFQDSGIEGSMIISRECLIDGPVKSNSLDEFWSMRARFIKMTYGEEESRYYERVQSEYQMICDLSPQSAVHLWFEYDLFCQINMWFVLSLLKDKEVKGIYRAAPITRKKNDLWKGYAGVTGDGFKESFNKSIRFAEHDVLLGASLWDAYQRGDMGELFNLSSKESPCFPYLREACIAEIDRKKNRRPERALRRILESGITDFNEIFRRFVEEDGVYGSGDLQVKAMYEKLTMSQERIF